MTNPRAQQLMTNGQTQATDHRPLATARRIGVFGGTFDPIHVGHLILAVEARHQLRLDQVVLVPAGDPPHKQGRPLAPLCHRLEMCQRAVANDHTINISLIDAERPGPHYTADTLRIFHNQLGPDVQIFFLMGLDSLRDLPTWHEPEWLMQNCQLVALQRHDVDIDWPSLEAALPGLYERIIMLDMPKLEIASSALRERVQTGQPIRYQVPRPVELYIQEHGLYREYHW